MADEEETLNLKIEIEAVAVPGLGAIVTIWPNSNNPKVSIYTLEELFGGERQES